MSPQSDAPAGSAPTVAIAPPKQKTKAAAAAVVEVKSSYSGPDRKMMAYIAGGAGGLGILMFGIFGLLSNSQFGRLESACSNNQCDASLESVRDRGDAYQTVANVSLVFGLVGLAGGGGLFVWDMMDKPDGGDKGTARSGIQKPQLAIGPGSVTFTGSF